VDLRPVHPDARNRGKWALPSWPPTGRRRATHVPYEGHQPVGTGRNAGQFFSPSDVGVSESSLVADSCSSPLQGGGRWFDPTSAHRNSRSESFFSAAGRPRLARRTFPGAQDEGAELQQRGTSRTLNVPWALLRL
jgi:hypothetical protein